MKLYATITSERASKSQGGKTISFKLQDANQNIAVIGEFSVDKVGQVFGEIIDYTSPETPTFKVGLLNQIGKRQKDEATGYIYDHNHGDGSKCDFHSL